MAQNSPKATGTYAILRFFLSPQNNKIILRILIVNLKWIHVIKWSDFANDFLGLVLISHSFDQRVSEDNAYPLLSNNQLYAHLKNQQRIAVITNSKARQHLCVSKIRGLKRRRTWFGLDFFLSSTIPVSTKANLSNYTDKQIKSASVVGCLSFIHKELPSATFKNENLANFRRLNKIHECLRLMLFCAYRIRLYPEGARPEFLD